MINFEDHEHFEIPDELPMLPIRDLVVFPYMIVPLMVSREVSIGAIDEALARDRMVFLVTQRDMSEEFPSPEGLYRVGAVGMIMRMRKTPDGKIKILVQALAKAQISEFLRVRPIYYVKVQRIVEPPVSSQLEAEALMRNVKENLERYNNVGKGLANDTMAVILNLDEPGRIADLVASNLGLKVGEAQDILEVADPLMRLGRVNEFLSKEVEVLQMQQKIQTAAKEEMSRTQREYYLREQLRAIRNELGDTDSKTEEIEELRERMERIKFPTDVRREADKQMKRLEGMHAEAAEATVLRTYLDWLLELPWSATPDDNLDLVLAKAVLDEDHYNLEKAKERILEFLGVLKLRRLMEDATSATNGKRQKKGPILCLVGPPGVGKTSLGRSIARAMGRRFVRVSLGGTRDEAEIRGHRRTYVGAMPGRILQGMKQAGTINPVFMLDEIDKLGADFRGDPSAALLEVLDPEQNDTFRDHYLNLPYDLSRVFFIATANLLEPIPAALRDRMEVIALSGYSEEEKLVIAKRYILPKQREDNGIPPNMVELPDAAVQRIVSQYTRESGLRNLEREVASVYRKVARRIAEGETKRVVVKAEMIHKLLGAPKYLPDDKKERDEVGVSTGLAWTQYGGEVLQVEATAMRGRGTLTLTGHLGDVMKESAQAALSFIRSRAKEIDLADDFFGTHELHLHVPAGATPKDGPSAGVTMATALYSLLSGRAVRHDVAMTGEITLRGRVLPVGGLKEKVLAALRAGKRTVVVPSMNEKDIEEIPEHVKKQISIRFAEGVDDVLNVALVPANVRGVRAEANGKAKRKSGGAGRRAAEVSGRPGPEAAMIGVSADGRRSPRRFGGG
jgi:ATP-dependent Lon protease